METMTTTTATRGHATPAGMCPEDMREIPSGAAEQCNDDDGDSCVLRGREETTEETTTTTTRDMWHFYICAAICARHAMYIVAF